MSEGRCADGYTNRHEAMVHQVVWLTPTTVYELPYFDNNLRN